MAYMGFPGTWMTETESVIYRVVPKCACSTIGQILYYSDHGQFFDGDIHDAKDGLHKWAQDHSQGPISRNVQGQKTYAFTCVRNPYTRVLSSFFDKICGIQRNGKRYRGNLVPKLMYEYGIEVGGDDGKQEFDQIQSFRRFLLFVRDSIRFRRPMDPDIHWSAMSGHVSTFIWNGGRYNKIFWTEAFNDGMQDVLDVIDIPHAVDLGSIPRFNESEGHGPKRAHPVEDYFDDLSMHLIYEIYKRDFELFKYDFENPANKMPIGEIDLDEVHAKLGE
jgi:Sulfotransferase family